MNHLAHPSLAFTLLFGLLCAAAAPAPPATDVPAPTRGFAILASSIGADFSPDQLAALVDQGAFAPVIVDWAWITYHWKRTDFRSLNRFLDLMAQRGVPVAAMYRPRFLANPDYPTQLGPDGQPKRDHAEICYSDSAARQWGISWGTQILKQCPRVHEIIIYNPSKQCHCSRCRTAPLAPVDQFLQQARAAWRTVRPGVKLGVVATADQSFWQSLQSTVDVAHPFLRVRAELPIAGEIENARAVTRLMRDKMGACLAKITWEADARVSFEQLDQLHQLAGQAGLAYAYWTFDSLMDTSLYDLQTRKRLLAMPPVKPLTSLPAVNDDSPPRNQPDDQQLTYTPDQIRITPAETFLTYMEKPQPGYHHFAALWALTRKLKQSDAAAAPAILSLVVDAMNDRQRPVAQRFQCCYVISGSRNPRGIPALINVLHHDPDETMRAVAAEALAAFLDRPEACEALLRAVRDESSTQVREVLQRHLGPAMPEPVPQPLAVTSDPRPAAGSSPRARPAVALSPPPPPRRPVSEPLPWPFPGDYKAQNIFNNYQQPTDRYVHAALDFLHPAGTPVTAVDSGYVALIDTNYPQWDTHYLFIITPEKGGNRGWCYTHLDPKTLTFTVGDYIEKGRLLGSLVDFSVGGRPGAAHLHLHYVEFSSPQPGRIDLRSLIDPLYYFDWHDTEPPEVRLERFAWIGSGQAFPADDDGVIRVNGKVDIFAAIADAAYPGHVGNLGVPVVMLSIRGQGQSIEKLVLDHRGPIEKNRLTKPLYLTHDEKKEFINPGSFPRYQVLRVSRTDGDGQISPLDRNQCWDTAARDRAGNPLWPDGEYTVTVCAWDIAGNLGFDEQTVRVRNGR